MAEASGCWPFTSPEATPLSRDRMVLFTDPPVWAAPFVNLAATEVSVWPTAALEAIALNHDRLDFAGAWEAGSEDSLGKEAFDAGTPFDAPDVAVCGAGCLEVTASMASITFWLTPICFSFRSSLGERLKLEGWACITVKMVLSGRPPLVSETTSSLVKDREP